MRIADNMNYTQINRNLGKNRTESSDLNNQAATMKRVTKPSDDPVAAARVLAARTEIAGAEQYQKSLNQARSFLDLTDQSLGEVTDSLARLKELAISQANEASANAVSRRSVATEVNQIYRQIVQVANRKLGDRYLFGGYKTTATPFQADGAYRGDDGEMMIEVNKGAFMAMNVPGSRVFLGKLDEDGRSSWSTSDVPLKDDEIRETQQEEVHKREMPEQKKATVRGPASIDEGSAKVPEGFNVFRVAQSLEIALKTNDTEGIQSTLELLDEAISQVVMARSQVGSRVAVLNSTLESLQKTNVDSKALASAYEDADVYQLFSDMSKNENTLKATLASSGKLAQLSLLDFIK